MSREFSQEFERLVASVKLPHNKGSRIPIELRAEVIRRLSELGLPTQTISELTRLSAMIVRNYLDGVPESRRPLADAERCLTPNCKGDDGRGLCRSCHASAASLIRRGRTSWEELESLGLACPKCGSRFERALAEARRRRGEGS